MTSKSTELVAYDTALFPALVEQDPIDVNARFAKRFMAAKNLDDLFDVLSGNTSKNMIGRKITIRSVHWAPFDSDRGVIPNAICDAVDMESGEVIEFVTTSIMCTMFIRQAELIGKLPIDVRVAGKKTRSGQTALNFERP